MNEFDQVCAETMATSTNNRLTDRQFARIARALAEPRRYQILKQIGASRDAAALQRAARGPRRQRRDALASHQGARDGRPGRDQREGKFMNLALNRDVLRTYLERLAKI